MKQFIKVSVVALAMTQLILAESPPVITVPHMPTPEVTVCPGMIEGITKPEHSAKPNDYSVSLLAKNAQKCRGVIIAPSWVLTAAHCAGTGLGYVTANKIKHKKRVAKKFRFKKGGDIALLKIYNAPFNQKLAAKVLGKPLRSGMGRFTYKKITHDAKRGTARVYGPLKLRVNNKKTLKSLTPKGKAGSSGSPWLVNTDVGDVVVAVTHGGSRAPQIAQARKWIDALVAKWTPNEKIQWVTDTDIILQAQ